MSHKNTRNFVQRYDSFLNSSMLVSKIALALRITQSCSDNNYETPLKSLTCN